MNKKFTITMQKKLLVLFLFLIAAFAGLSARLVLIGKDHGEQYKRQVLSQQRYDSVTIPFRRGDIVDSKGTKLAVSEKVYNVILDAKLAGEREDYIQPTAQALAKCFGLNASDIVSYIRENPTSQYYVLARKLPYDTVNPFVEMQNNKEENPNIKGVWFEEEYIRTYPNGKLGSHVIGFVGTDNAGTYGLEEYYNDTLNGVNGREYGYLNDDSDLERTTKAPVDGYTIVSTIDANIQNIVEKYLKKFNEDNKDAARTGNGAVNTGAIIMEVDTGNILAMASYPDYDLNDTKNKDALVGTILLDKNGKTTEEVITPEIAQNMDDETMYANLNALWKNFCINSTYEPGSVAKPFTVAAALETGRITGNEVYFCGGSLWKGGHEIHCHNRLGDGQMSVKSGVEKSCNVVLMHIGEALGKTNYLKFQEEFNFGLRTNIDLAGETRTSALVYNDKTMNEAELATSTFGQGFNVTMIQTIAGFSSLVNGGYYYEPHMVSKIVDPEGNTVKNIEPRLLKQTISASTSAKIVDYCNGVVLNGTGKTARPAGYAIGGKTGTAEMAPRNKRNYVVSFMGYAPADDPKIAVYVVVDRPNTYVQDDAKYATGIVRNILTEVLPYLHFFMTEELSEKEVEEMATVDPAINTGIKNEEEDLEGVIVENGQEKPKTTESDSLISGAMAESGSGNTEEVPQEVLEWQERIAAYETDPETGYLIEPDTGVLIDPATGQAMDGASFLD